MGKFDGVLLASDFDNTILNTELPRRTGCPIPPISQRNVEALRYFMDNGGRFAVATGRALPAFRMFAEQVPMNAPAVVCNGGRRVRMCWTGFPQRQWRPITWTM